MRTNNNIYFFVVSLSFVTSIKANENGETNFWPTVSQTVRIGKTTFYVYKNIPFSEPITEESRFQPPKPLPVNSDFKPKPDEEKICPQVKVSDGNPTWIGKEDCLYLDVYSTQDKQDENDTPIPVFVYFHGGRFMNGSKNDYFPSYLMRSEQKMIVVIPNYRLNVLGFLSANGSTVSGNIGLLDQQLALKWVNENINQIGGDTKRVTIGGHDAGGASVHLHILSTVSQSFFSSAISGSGSALDPWVFSKRTFENVLEFSQNISCRNVDAAGIVDCLKRKSLDDIMNTLIRLHNITFGPVVDGTFLTEDPEALYLKNIPDIPLLAGVTQHEASIEFYQKYSEASKGNNLDVMLTYLMNPYFKRKDRLEIVIKAAKYHYLRGNTPSNLLDFAPSIITIMTDFLYNSGLERLLQCHYKFTQNIWMYVFRYSGDMTMATIFGPPEYLRGRYGASHMDDVFYLFNTTFFSKVYENNPDDIGDIDTVKFIDRYSSIWRDFIINGNLNEKSGQERWTNSSKKYLDITATADRYLNNYRQTDMDFWNILVQDLLNIEDEVDPPQKLVAKSSTTNWGIAGLAIMLAILCLALTGVIIVMRKKFSRKCNRTNSMKLEQNQSVQDKKGQI